MLEKGTLTIDKNQQQLLHTIAFSTFRLLKYDESSQFPPPPSKFRTPPPNLGIINVLTHAGRWPPMFWQT